MVVRVLGDVISPAYSAAVELIKRRGYAVDDGTYYYADVAVAPLLTRKIPPDELGEPVHGTLVFHPSPLPYGRGPAAIRHAYRRGEPVTAATWFWATGELDAGDICEQEIIRIDHEMRPRDFYERDVIPAMLRTLDRALANLASGVVRRIPQVERYASYDGKI